MRLEHPIPSYCEARSLVGWPPQWSKVTSLSSHRVSTVGVPQTSHNLLTWQKPRVCPAGIRCGPWVWRCYSKCCTVLEMKNQLWCGWGQHPLSWTNLRWLLCKPRSRKPVASKPPPQVSPAPGSVFVFPWIHLEKGEDGILVLDQILFIKPLLTFSDPVAAQQQGRAVLELSLHAVSNENRGEWGTVNVDGGRLKIFLLWAASCKVIQEITLAFKFYERALKHKMPFI